MWDGFFLHALLRDTWNRNIALDLPHRGENSSRLNTALSERNSQIAGTGQQLWAHACDHCMKVVTGLDGTLCKCNSFHRNHCSQSQSCVISVRLTACVTDGVTVGHPCCCVHNCQTPLGSQRHRFCPNHSNLHFQCAIIGCSQATSESWRTCTLPDHRALETQKREEGRAVFHLRAKLSRALGGTNIPPPLSEEEFLDEIVETDVPATGSSTSAPRLRSHLTRKWTHNEQLMVRCCGIIIARATFFGSEAITSVKVCSSCC